jgi:hypothetical protein
MDFNSSLVFAPSWKSSALQLVCFPAMTPCLARAAPFSLLMHFGTDFQP